MSQTMGRAGLRVACLALLAVGTCASPAVIDAPTELRADSATANWWDSGVIYQIYPRSFKDSDGDGVGDLKGITSKLEYLKDLGIAAVWLSPIYPSPQKDFGYDISDFIAVDPQYGTMADFDELIQKAHSLGIKVVLDFVPNHSSDQHEWFKKSVKRISPYDNYYVWNDGKFENGVRKPPNNWVQSFRGSAWEWNQERGQYYLHQYAEAQPDLNYRSQELVDEMKNAVRFWMKKGVDGLRVDTVFTLFEDEQLRDEPRNTDGGETDPLMPGYLNHIYTQDQPETYDMVCQWMTVLREFDEQRMMMTEAYTSLDKTIAYYGTKEKPGATFPFNFKLITDLNAESSASDFKKVIDDWMSKMDDFKRPNWVIGNHDQNRVSSFYRYGPELADGLNMISLIMPGTTMTYNGDEIGMDNTFITWAQTKDPQAINQGPKNYLTHSRDLTRTPFQWDDSTSAGFSVNKATWLPVNPNYWHLNLENQKKAAHSHYKMYKALLEARKQPAVRGADYESKVVGNSLIINRSLKGADSFTVVVNMGSEETVISLNDIGSFEKLNVWTSSVGSTWRPGDTIRVSFKLRPKESLTLTSGDVKTSSAASGPTALLTILLVPLMLTIQL